jgi:cytochrome P450
VPCPAPPSPHPVPPLPAPRSRASLTPSHPPCPPKQVLTGVETIGPEELARLPLTEAVLKETLRLDGPGPVIARESLVDEALPSGQHIPRGTHLWISPWLLHNDEDKWASPELFHPDRWLQQRPEPWQFLPFSNGPRNCIGQRFAMQEAKLILGLMMRRFSLGHVPHNLVRETAITQRPINGILMRLLPR